MVASDAALFDVRTLQDTVNRSLAERRLGLELAAVFTALSPALCLLVIYGLVAYTVGLKGGEIAIRKALGAESKQIVRAPVRQALMLPLAGETIGLILAVVAARVMSSLLYNVNPNDPYVLVLAFVSLMVASGAASFLPAHGTTKLDPMAILRYE